MLVACLAFSLLWLLIPLLLLELVFSGLLHPQLRGFLHQVGALWSEELLGSQLLRVTQMLVLFQFKLI